ncbi:MAG: AAA family ATPase [Phycisphaerae bacterium]|nr:AAA family ATPase [Phycisphaerae bacterium]
MSAGGENERLLSQLQVRGGRRQLIVSGHVHDLFFVDLAHGLQPLREAIRIHGERNGYEVILFVDAAGRLSFARPGMRDIYESHVRAVTPPVGGAGTGGKVFTPTSGSGVVSGGGHHIREQVTGSAQSEIQTTYDHIARLLRSGSRSMVVFEYPEKLWIGSPNHQELRHIETVIRWGLADTGHPDNCSILVVNPNRLAEFESVANHCIDRSNFSRTIRIGPPPRKELELFVQRLTCRYGLRGSPKRIAAAAHGKQLSLYDFSQLVLDHLAKSPGIDFLEGLFSAQEQTQTLDELLADLDALVGLSEVKQKVRELLKMAEEDSIRRRTGEEGSLPSYHMFFLGNPGTGKTVVARLLGRIFWALGIRSGQAFVEISAQDVSSPWNPGDAIQRMAQAVDRAMGGVLFVDEVYLLAEDQWSRQALETLMKAMEDHRDNLTVIMAGYEEKLPELFKVNPGFRSRVNHTLRFPDYSASELGLIFASMCRKAGLTLSEEAKSKLARYIESCDRRGGLGNGRGARNLFERVQTAVACSGRHDGQIRPEHIPDPVCFREADARRVLDQIEGEFIGLQKVKAELSRLFIRQKGIERKGGALTGFNHFLFLGGPGTGKTSVARKMGELFYFMGLISEPGKLIEVDISDMMSAYQAEYATKVRDCFDRAVGGVLFLDEAYRLAGDDQGRKVLDQIVRLITENRYRDLVMIMAGYHDEMQKLLESNVGLKRRFAHTLHFEDFTADELVTIFHRCVAQDRCRVNEAERASFDANLRSMLEQMSHERNFGNAGRVQTFYENVVKVNQELRLDREPGADPHELRLADLLGKEQGASSVGAILAELDRRFVGMAQLKETIRQWARRMEFESRRRELLPGLAQSGDLRLNNMRFVGNPGTGKTTVARYMARVLNALQMIASTSIYECRGVDLKGSWLGQTKDKVNDLFTKAAGQLILIDEVYSLYDPQAGQTDTYGREAIDALVGNITDPKNSGTVIVLAGYKDRLDTFLRANAGLASRFPYEIEFPDYSVDECLEILWQKFRAEGLIWPEGDPAFEGTLRRLFARAKSQPFFGNAREVGNAFERIKTNLAQRVLNMPAPQSRDYSCVTLEDIHEL